MVCIQCGSETKVINSRPQKRLNQVWRRRRCSNCGSVFTSQESADYSAAVVVKGASGRLRPFSRDKLFISLLKSCEHRPDAIHDAGALADTIISKLIPQHVVSATLEARHIITGVQVALNRFDKSASVHYAAFHKQ